MENIIIYWFLRFLIWKSYTISQYLLWKVHTLWSSLFSFSIVLCGFIVLNFDLCSNNNFMVSSTCENVYDMNDWNARLVNIDQHRCGGLGPWGHDLSLTWPQPSWMRPIPWSHNICLWDYGLSKPSERLGWNVTPMWPSNYCTRWLLRLLIGLHKNPRNNLLKLTPNPVLCEPLLS